MIKKLFRQMVVTQILSAMTVALCMLVDSIMIGRFLGVDSMTAYGLATPVLLIFAALGSIISAGVQVVCGRMMGSGDKNGANACYTASVTLGAVIAAIGVTAVLVFTDPICTLLGAGANTPDNAVFGLTRDYLRGFIIGAPAFMGAQIMLPYMQMSGGWNRLVAAVIAMTVGDVAFDFLNVVVFRQGTLGMGLASSLSYYLAFGIGASFILSKRFIFRLKPRSFRVKDCGELIVNGIPTLVNQISMVLLVYVLNQILLSVGGNKAVAAFSVMTTVGNICYAFGGGIGSVSLTLSSILYSDEDRTALKTLMRIMVRYAVIMCSIVTAAVILSAPVLVSLFLEDADAYDIAVHGLRIFVLSLVPSALNTAFKNFYQGVERVGVSLVISLLQNFCLIAAAAWILSRFLGLTGIWIGYICGESLTFLIVCIIVYCNSRKKGFSKNAFMLLGDSFGVKPEQCLELTVQNAADPAAISQKVSAFCASRGLGGRTANIISLCVEEIANNTVKHGFQDKRGNSLDIRVTIRKDATVLRFRDDCRKFDPVKYVKLHSEDEEDKAAHIGIRMVMKLVRHAKYVYTLGLNNLTLEL